MLQFQNHKFVWALCMGLPCKLLHGSFALANFMRCSISTISWHWPIKEKTDCCKTVAWACQLLSRMLGWACSVNKLPPAEKVELANDELKLLYKSLTLAHCLHHSILAISWHWPMKKKRIPARPLHGPTSCQAECSNGPTVGISCPLLRRWSWPTMN